MKRLLMCLLLVFIPMICFGQTYQYRGSGVITASDCSGYTSIGQLCQDTDDGKLYKGTGEAVEEVAGGGGGVAGKICKTITNPSAADNLLFDIASARTVTKLWGISVGGTSVVATLVNAGGDGTGDTTIASFTVDGDGATQETIASASLANGDVIKLDVGTVTGVVTQVMVCYE